MFDSSKLSANKASQLQIALQSYGDAFRDWLQFSKYDAVVTVTAITSRGERAGLQDFHRDMGPLETVNYLIPLEDGYRIETFVDDDDRRDIVSVRSGEYCAFSNNCIHRGIFI